MAEFVLNKLVLDGVLDKMFADGQKPIFRFIEGDELLRALLEKVKEEATEALTVFDDASKRNKEVIDVLRVANAIAKKENYICTIELDDVDSKGNFEKGIFIETVQVPDDSKWTAYYRQDPQRFPEIGVDPLDSVSMPDFTTGQYRHYKGSEYEALSVGCHSETLEFYVVYKPLHSQAGKPSIWLRPFDMFMGNVQIEGQIVPRFELIQAA